MGNESFINAVIDTYTVEDIMSILNVDDEYIIRRFLKPLILAHKEMFDDAVDME